MDNKLIRTAMIIGLIAVLTLLLFLTLEVSSLRKQINNSKSNMNAPANNSLSIDLKK